MAESTNRFHVSPGVYTSQSVDMKAATKSVGVTKLGMVCETLKGPAFQAYKVTTPKEYASVFGGTSTEKFKGSNYPKYEGPYIANAYLEEGTQLYVVRVLGFSGYNAGPAWVITGRKSNQSDGKNHVIAVLRSRGTYKYRAEYAKLQNGECTCQNAYDSMTFDVGEIKNVVSCSAPISYNMDAVKIGEYTDINADGNLCSSYSLAGEPVGYSASVGDMGHFTIHALVGAADKGTAPIPGADNTVSIPVSLNPSDKDYILKVLGTSNSDGDQPLFVESLYDVAWEDLVVNQGFDTINSALTTYNVGYVADYCGLDPVSGILTKHPNELTKKDIGKRYLYSTTMTDASPSGMTYYPFVYQTNVPEGETVGAGASVTWASAQTSTKVIDYKSLFELRDGQYKGIYRNTDGGPVQIKDLIKGTEILNTDPTISVTKITGELELIEKTCEEGHIYTVTEITTTGTKKKYGYKAYNEASISGITDIEEYILVADRLRRSDEATSATSKGMIVYCYEDGLYYKNNGSGDTNSTTPVLCDLNDYKSEFRYSSTPWVVSNAKGDANHINLNRLFRFHTISDGANSIEEVKVSIENIRPDAGQFDVVVRSYNDIDSNVTILERYSKCTMVPGTSFIGYKIGTIDGQYESKSKYITVEVIESTATANSIPAGFLGYSIPRYDSASVFDNGKDNIEIAPITYNTEYNEDVAKRKQYFGISNISGYDYDYFSYKGKMSTLEDPEFMSHGFHLDCRLNQDIYNGNNIPAITVDGIGGYIFDTVNVNARTATYDGTPIIASEKNMAGSIFEDVKLRKFTMAFAGGFDGWDIYRDQRTNTDDFSYNTYKGYVNKKNGIGYAFNTLNSASNYNIEGGALTSDYYSTLAGISLLKNPEEVDINLLVTPGIDTINNTKLVNEVFDVLEDRADTFYFVTTPDKPSGAGDYEDEIPEVDEIVQDFLDKDLHSDYAATHGLWVKIEDNGQYLWIPVTRDIVRNIAESDNGNTTQNLAPAGLKRGKVKAIRARKNLKDAESDALYEANINPVRTFSSDDYSQKKIVIMGQKTLRSENDLANRIDVMRCLMRIRKLIAIASLGLVFDPEDETTVKSFKKIVSSIMEGFVKNRAVSKWYLETDDSQEAKDRHEIPSVLYVMPIGAVEYITLNVIATNNGVYFER